MKCLLACVWFWGVVWAQDEAFLSLMREYNEARLLAGQLRADEAVSRLKTLIAADWKFRRAYFTLAEVSVHTGRVQEAETYFLELLAKNPGNGYAWYGLAEVKQLRSQPNKDELANCLQASPEAVVCYSPEVLPFADPAYPGYWYAKSIDANRLRKEEVESAAKAVEVAKSRHDDDYLPMLLMQLAVAFRSSSYSHEEALRCNRSAAELASRQLDQEAASEARARAAELMQRLGRSQEARQIIEGLLQDARESGDWKLVSARAGTLAALCTETGDYDCARQAWKDDLEYQQLIHSVKRQVHALYRLGETELLAVDPKASIGWLEAALKLNVISQKPFLLRTLAGAHLMQGDSFLALRRLTESRDEFRAQGKNWQAGADTGSLGNLYASLGDDALAERCYRESVASARKSRDLSEEQRVMTALARLLVRQNRLEEASAAAAVALERSKRVRYSSFQPAMYLVLSDVAARRGRRQEARGWLDRSLTAARELSLYSEEVQSLIRLEEWESSAGRMAEALQFGRQAVQTAKTRGLVWPLADAYHALGRLELKVGEPAAAWEQLRAAMEVAGSLRGKLPNSDLHVGFSRKMWPVYDDAVNALAAMGSAAAALEVSERGRARAFLELLPSARGRDGARALDQEQLLAFTRQWSGTVLVYVLSEPHSTAWLLDGDEVRMARLAGRGSIERLVRRYRQMLSEPPQEAGADYRKVSRELYRALVAPLADGLKAGRTLAIVPDGILHYLPFETLAGAGGRVLVNDHAVTYVPSVSVLASLSRGAGGDAGRRELLAYGDPRFAAGRTHEGNVRALYRAAGYRFFPLPATRQEVLAIGSYFPPPMRTLLVGTAATEQSVKETDLSSYRRLHFATHAVLDERVPARSGIVLSQVATGREDGILHASEVMDLKLDSGLVVLSACRTGLGQVVGGEGIVGLTRSFFHAGARRVAVSLWDVNDQSTARLMKEFYHGLSEGNRPADALRAAKLSFLRAAAPLYQHPHYWAAFVLSGVD